MLLQALTVTPQDYTMITHSVLCFKPKKFDFAHQTVSPFGGCGLGTRLDACKLRTVVLRLSCSISDSLVAVYAVQCYTKGS